MVPTLSGTRLGARVPKVSGNNVIKYMSSISPSLGARLSGNNLIGYMSSISPSLGARVNGSNLMGYMLAEKGWYQPYRVHVWVPGCPR